MSFLPNKAGTFNLMKLPDNVKIKVMEFCDVKTKLNLSETCSKFNTLLFTTPLLMKQIQLRLSFHFNEDQAEDDYIEQLNIKLKTLAANKRPYLNVNLFRIDHALKTSIRDSLFKTLEDIGWSVKTLFIFYCKFDSEEIRKILWCFDSVVKIIFYNARMIIDHTKKEPQFDHDIVLPELTRVQFKFSDLEMLRFLKANTSIERLDIRYPYDGTNEKSRKIMQNFTVSQTKLKKIVINISLMNILEDLLNESVAKIILLENGEIPANIFTLFPNVAEIISEGDGRVKLDDYPLEKMRRVRIPWQKNFYFVPQFEDSGFDIEKCENYFIDLIINSRSCPPRDYIIGEKSWIDKGIGISLSFWIALIFRSRCLETPSRLSRFYVYNPLQLKELIMFIKCSSYSLHRKTFGSLTLYTSKEGLSSIEGIILPKYVDVKECRFDLTYGKR